MQCRIEMSALARLSVLLAASVISPFNCAAQRPFQNEVGVQAGASVTLTRFGARNQFEARYPASLAVGLYGSRRLAAHSRWGGYLSGGYLPWAKVQVAEVATDGDDLRSRDFDGRRYVLAGGITTSLHPRALVRIGAVYSRFDLQTLLSDGCPASDNGFCQAGQHFAEGTRGWGLDVGLRSDIMREPFRLGLNIEDVVSSPNTEGAPALLHSLLVGIALTW